MIDEHYIIFKHTLNTQSQEHRREIVGIHSGTKATSKKLCKELNVRLKHINHYTCQWHIAKRYKSLIIL